MVCWFIVIILNMVTPEEAVDRSSYKIVVCKIHRKNICDAALELLVCVATLTEEIGIIDLVHTQNFSKN